MPLPRGFRRPRRLKATDQRCPLLRLLEDGQCAPEEDGSVMIAVNYHEQWRTLWRAQRLGYVTDDHLQHLTEKGRKYLAAHQST